MARRMTPSEIRSKLRQVESRQKQAVQKFKQDIDRQIRQAESKRREVFQKYNQAVNQYNQGVKRVVDNYNREVRAYNNRVRINQQRIQSALAKIQRTPVTRSYTVLRTSTFALNDAYNQLEQQTRFDESDPRYRLMVESTIQENANNLNATSAVLGYTPEEPEPQEKIGDTSITNELSRVSPDLNDRWRGALFSLNPRNPDATRHFCTSVREIFSSILDLSAPDANVLAVVPNCAKTQKGCPTRRSKIHYLLQKKGMAVDAFVEFVDKDIENVLDLFEVFNAGTHGEAGKYDLPKLFSLKRRVEDAILFVTEIAI